MTASQTVRACVPLPLQIVIDDVGWWSGEDGHERGEPFRFESSMAKLICTEGAGRVVDRCMQIFGGLGMAKEMPLERWYRELRIRRVGEGPSEVQRIVMARDILNVRSGS